MALSLFWTVAVGWEVNAAALQSATEEGGRIHKWHASWIWHSPEGQETYNDTAEAIKRFNIDTPTAAVMRITADSRYRLYINGTWVNDGPARSWPDHFQYDVLDACPFLQSGENEVRIIAKYYGVGTFHQIPQAAGVLAQLDVQTQAGEQISICTDESWLIRPAKEWLQFTPKQSVQVWPFEIYDARVAQDKTFSPAVRRYAAEAGPWGSLFPRDVALMTRVPFDFKAFQGASLLAPPAWKTFIFPTAVLTHKRLVYANNRVVTTGAFATLIEVVEKTTVRVDADGNKVFLEGQQAHDNCFEISPGCHLLYCVLSEYWGHWRQDTEIKICSSAPVGFLNPISGNRDAPWCFIPFPNTDFQFADYAWGLMSPEQQQTVVQIVEEQVQNHCSSPPTKETFLSRFQGVARVIGPHKYTEAPHFLFKDRNPIASMDEETLLIAPENLILGNLPVVIHPPEEGDVELVYDLGTQNVGYYDFSIDGEDGLIMDIFGVEYITPEGRVQHTERYRNGMRYICREGMNHFCSLFRRSQRYVFITLRNQTRPAMLHRFKLIESTYPVTPVGSFECNDEILNRIWNISAHTLKLCMEDTFTDCPLYEQTYWVADARKEALFAYAAFNATDIAARCIRIGAYSLDKYPMVLCQAPSTWETLLPAWSFIWGLMVWDYYAYTADKEFLTWAYPYVIKNLQGAEQFMDDRGLFSGPFWNMFDWAGIDDGHHTVLHNSMFFVGALDAARKCAQALQCTKHTAWIDSCRQRITTAIEDCWNPETFTYPDSMHADGNPSKRTSLHTVFLSLLFDIAPQERRERLKQLLIDPPENMTGIGSSLAQVYLLETYDKLGMQDHVINEILRCYTPMIELGSSTVWESFLTGSLRHGEFPTRSHTHACSAAPIYFFNRILLGILPEGEGGLAFVISPRLNGLTRASGTTATIKGPVHVSWQLDGKRLDIQASGPEGTQLRYLSNDTHAGLQITFNGISINPDLPL